MWLCEQLEGRAEYLGLGPQMYSYQGAETMPIKIKTVRQMEAIQCMEYIHHMVRCIGAMTG